MRESLLVCWEGGLLVLEATERLAKSLGHPADLVIRPVPSIEGEVVYLVTMVDPERVEDRLLGGLVTAGRAPAGAGDLLAWLQQHLRLGTIRQAGSLSDANGALMDGMAVLCTPAAGFFVADVQGTEHRPPKEPQTETAIRGARDGFTETLQTNLSLIRVRLRDPDLRVEELRLGTRSRVRVALAYQAEFASPDLLNELKQRIGRAQIDAILESGQLEQWIEDTPWSPYPQVQVTERPDKVVAALMEGRIAILVEGTPFALLVPAVMASFFQSLEDYSERWLFGTLLRLARISALGVSILAPSFYVAMTMFNPELMPLKMALSLAASREGIPFPIVVEALVMEAMVELLREAGSRMPKSLGQALGIVGGLVIGDIGIKARIVSPIMVIVVGLTALGSFAIPSYEAALTTRMLRFPMVLVTGLFGITGLVAFVLLIFAHLCTLRSFGVPYLTPLAQLSYREWGDTLVRAPVRSLIHRPGTYAGRIGRRGQPEPGRDPKT